MKPTLFLAALLLAGAADAQTVWRCGADGRSYSAEPCADGRIVVAADTRSVADVEAARDVAERERALARDLAQQRRRYEAQLPVMAGIRHEQPVAVKSIPKKKAKATPTPEAHGTWRAVAPASPRKPG